MKVAVVGATGETGGSIINGLLEHPFPFVSLFHLGIIQSC